jgi:hypothetical protein
VETTADSEDRLKEEWQEDVMKKWSQRNVVICLCAICLLLVGHSAAQQTTASATVPRLIRFSGAVKDADGKPRMGVTGITFALYKDQEGGAALWTEVQNVQLDGNGRYTALLGASTAEGVPLEVFSANEARWLGVQPEDQAEQPRVLLVSVPYALKAAEAESLGGKPASAYVLSPTAGPLAASPTKAASPAAACSTPPCPVITPGGTASFIPMFTDPTTVQNSPIAENLCAGTGLPCVGIGNSNPTRTLDVNGEIRVAGGNIFMQRNLTDLAGRRNWAWGTETFNVGDVSLFVSTSNTAFPSVPVFTALSNANMGIGLPTPAAKLDVLGNGNFVASASGVIALSAQATDAANFNTAIRGLADGAAGAGVVGEAENGSGAIGVWGLSSNGTAGVFSGNVSVSGTLSATAKNFRIDHPLDPAGKYLYHASVESSEMMNIYTGNAVLDESGAVVVQLPTWFEALNTDFRYQLTAVGGPGPGLYVAQEIQSNSFRIAGGTPGLKVSWQVTGVRQDAFARTNPLAVEVEKSERERGYYIHPLLFGQSPAQSIEWAQHPLQMKRRQQSQATEKPR